jgi:hypothetical protein
VKPDENLKKHSLSIRTTVTAEIKYAQKSIETTKNPPLENNIISLNMLHLILANLRKQKHSTQSLSTADLV